MANSPHKDRVTANLRIWRSERDLLLRLSRERGISVVNFVLYAVHVLESRNLFDLRDFLDWQHARGKKHQDAE